MNLFNIIKEKKEFWLADQIKKQDVTAGEYEDQLKRLFDEWNAEGVGYLSILMDEQYEFLMKELGLRKISSIVEYTRTLTDLPPINSAIKAYSLAEGKINDNEFANLYELCRSGSANKNIQQPIETIMNSLNSELGPNWRGNCYYFMMDKSIVGISIPHLEMGTTNEGRLFYFGVVPEYRGKGIGTDIHKSTLALLPQFGAEYYVGSTDVHNENMIKIFVRNGCTLRDRKGIYRIDR